MENKTNTYRTPNIAARLKYLLIFPILLIFSIFQSTHAQEQWRVFRNNNVQVYNYLPEYNLWTLKPAQNGLLNHPQISPYQNPPFVTDSIFTWQYVQTQVFWTNDIFFIDSLYGWAAYNAAPAGGVMRTTDSGFNWDSTGLAPGGMILGVHFIDRNIGWAVGTASRIRKTTDGGINWIAQDSFGYGVYYNYLYSVHFFNPDTGIIIGERARGYYNSWGGCVLKTTDGGENWNQVYSTNDTNYSSTKLLSQIWLNNDTGWFSGYNILLRTTDGGVTFTNYYSHVPPTQNGYNALNGVYFVNENTGWLCAGNLDHKNIYKTTNAGINWIFQDNPVAYYEYPQINGILFINSDTGWASSYVGIILVTTNSGNNWLIDNMAANEFWRFTNTGFQKIWCTSGFGQIWYTTIENPNGLSNQQQRLPNEFILLNNYPNPFNPSTNISYQLPIRSHVSLVIYNILGEEIENLTDKEQNSGKYKLKWNASAYPSGIYFCRLETNNYTETRKMVLLK